jgi:hypothetical protein
MKLSRKDLQTLQIAAQVAEAQQRLMSGPEENAWHEVIIGTAAGLCLLLLSGLAVQSLIQHDRSEDVTAGEQVVWNEGGPAPLLR